MKMVFVIVGVGGTGSLLARDIPKLLIGSDHLMILVDGDKVEKKNMVRQSYQEHDIGEYKAVALSSKINSFYGDVCEAIHTYITKDELIVKLQESYHSYVPVLVGCVDNDATRKILEHTFNVLDDCIYLDSANEKYEGNVYVTAKADGKKVGKLRSEVYELSKDRHPTEKSCQELAANNIQFLMTNAKMATCLLEHISAIVSNDLKAGVSVVKRFEQVHY